MPAFSPFVIADNGELTPTAISFQEWLVEAYRCKIQQDSRTDGLTISRLVTDFRHRLKIAVQIALAAGLGVMIAAAGQQLP